MMLQLQRGGQPAAIVEHLIGRFEGGADHPQERENHAQAQDAQKQRKYQFFGQRSLLCHDLIPPNSGPIFFGRTTGQA
ncbi:hypothetical protein D3C76_1558930 [compost metagenome]